MIEMVYSGKESEGQDIVRIPKNIRQMGTNNSNKKVYIEDYVMTHLKNVPHQEEKIRYGVLLGEVKRNKGNIYVFIRGMAEVREILENSLIFNDDIWSGIYKDIKQYFDGLNIVGWFVSVPYRVNDDMKGIRKIHLDNFAGNEKVCFLSDRTENEDGFYFYEQGNLVKQQGYYIYYEKNEKMKKYVKNISENKNDSRSKASKINQNDSNNKGNKINQNDCNSEANITKTNDNSNNIIKKSMNDAQNKKYIFGDDGNVVNKTTVHKEPNEAEIKDVTANRSQEPKSFGEILKHNKARVTETGSQQRQGRVAYTISALLIVALLLSTVVMLNNYGELKNIKQTLVSLNKNNEAQAVNEILGAYTAAKNTEETNLNEYGTSRESASNRESSDSGSETSNGEANNRNVNDKNKKNEDANIKNMNNEDVKKDDGDTNSNIDSINNENSDMNDDENQSDDKEPANNSISGKYHTVKSGQTLYDISMKYYGTSAMVDEIKESNNIDDDYKIVEGQKLLLP